MVHTWTDFSVVTVPSCGGTCPILLFCRSKQASPGIWLRRVMSMDIEQIKTLLVFSEFNSPHYVCHLHCWPLPLPHNRYVMSRLMSLCELYISKHVERATKYSIAKADVDIIHVGKVIHSLSYQPKQLTLMAVHIHVHIRALTSNQWFCCKNQLYYSTFCILNALFIYHVNFYIVTYLCWQKFSCSKINILPTRPHTPTHRTPPLLTAAHATRLNSAVGAFTSSQAISIFLRETNNSCNWAKTTSLLWRSIDGHHCFTRPLWTSIRPSTSILRGRSQVGVV